MFQPDPSRRSTLMSETVAREKVAGQSRSLTSGTSDHAAMPATASAGTTIETVEREDEQASTPIAHAGGRRGERCRLQCRAGQQREAATSEPECASVFTATIVPTSRSR